MVEPSITVAALAARLVAYLETLVDDSSRCDEFHSIDEIQERWLCRFNDFAPMSDFAYRWTNNAVVAQIGGQYLQRKIGFALAPVSSRVNPAMGTFVSSKSFLLTKRVRSVKAWYR